MLYDPEHPERAIVVDAYPEMAHVAPDGGLACSYPSIVKELAFPVLAVVGNVIGANIVLL